MIKSMRYTVPVRDIFYDIDLFFNVSTLAETLIRIDVTNVYGETLYGITVSKAVARQIHEALGALLDD